jgi:protein TonB
MNLNNLALRFYDEPEYIAHREPARVVSLTRWPRLSQRREKSRLTAIIFTAILHVVLVSLLMFSMNVPKAATSNDLTVVSLAPMRDTNEPPPPPKVIPPELKVFVPAPEVTIVVAAPARTITAEVPPPQPVSTDAQNDYFARLFAHLNHHKRVVRAPRGQAKVMLSFTVDKAGNVLDYALAKASGIQAVDEEAVALLQRAQPLPAFPASLHREQLKLVLPIDLASR